MQEVIIQLTHSDKVTLCRLLFASVVVICIGILYLVIQEVIRAWKQREFTKKKIGVFNYLLVASVTLLFSVWFLRYAVGYYDVIIKRNELTSTEEIFNSIVHTLQTFSMDEDYTEYIAKGREMMANIFGANSKWINIYGIYASVLNTIAPFVGGAVIFEVLASVFPKIRLSLSHCLVWKEKYYFSELNYASLAVFKSLYNKKYKLFCKPIFIFTDAYTDDEYEKSFELYQSAKAYGAICVRDDLANIRKNWFGKRNFVLIDENEGGNLRTLAKLSGNENYKYLKKAKIYLFSQDDAYIQVEREVRAILKSKKYFQKSRLEKLVGSCFKKNILAKENNKLPQIIPIQKHRNMISRMLVETPLYEPIIHKRNKEKGEIELNITILGTGAIGVEMFLATYWFAQMLDVKPIVNIVSNESEEQFWSKIDLINPEIRETTLPVDSNAYPEEYSILKYNDENYSNPYLYTRYISCDVYSSEFIKLMSDKNKKAIVEADYIFVALGSDEKNIFVANTVCKYVGHQHYKNSCRTDCVENNRTIINYVVYNPDLARSLNYEKFCYSVDRQTPDIFMQAVGDLESLYDWDNITMAGYESKGDHLHKAYMKLIDKNERAVKETEIESDYKHWANIARAMHQKYKAFSIGFATKSIFDIKAVEGDEYEKIQYEIHRNYRRFSLAIDKYGFSDEEFKRIINECAWLEHRRWNAFTRVKGYKNEKNPEKYIVQLKSHKNGELKLHPCLVECDKLGIRTTISEVNNKTRFSCMGEKNDYLDDLSIKLNNMLVERNGKTVPLTTIDFKYYDYPDDEFSNLSVADIVKKYHISKKAVKKICKTSQDKKKKVKEWEIPQTDEFIDRFEKLQKRKCRKN